MNPTFESMYFRSWLDGNGCNTIYCSKQNQEVAILHSVDCIANDRECGWVPYKLNIKSESEVTHLKDQGYTYETKMRCREILWSKLVEDIF